MKKVLLFMLMCVLSLHAYSQSKDYYYQHGVFCIICRFTRIRKMTTWQMLSVLICSISLVTKEKILEGNYVSSHSHMLQNKKWFRPFIRHSQFHK